MILFQHDPSGGGGGGAEAVCATKRGRGDVGGIA